MFLRKRPTTTVEMPEPKRTRSDGSVTTSCTAAQPTSALFQPLRNQQNTIQSTAPNGPGLGTYAPNAPGF